MECMFSLNACSVAIDGKLLESAITFGRNVILAKQHGKRKSNMSMGFATLGKATSMPKIDRCRMASITFLVSGCVSIGIALTLTTLGRLMKG